MKISKVLGKFSLEKTNKQNNNNNETKAKTKQTTKQTATLKLKRIYQFIKSFYHFAAISQ